MRTRIYSDALKHARLKDDGRSALHAALNPKAEAGVLCAARRVARTGRRGGLGTDGGRSGGFVALAEGCRFAMAIRAPEPRVTLRTSWGTIRGGGRTSDKFPMANEEVDNGAIPRRYLEPQQQAVPSWPFEEFDAAKSSSG
jgi:hypothetical protein